MVWSYPHCIVYPFVRYSTDPDLGKCHSGTLQLHSVRQCREELLRRCRGSLSVEVELGMQSVYILPLSHHSLPNFLCSSFSILSARGSSVPAASPTSRSDVFVCQFRSKMSLVLLLLLLLDLPPQCASSSAYS